MPGIRISNNHCAAVLVLMAASLGLACADHLTLAGDARLSGEIRSINPAGVIELASALSPEPLLLKPGAVEKVDFSIPDSEEVPASTLIELLNGDVLAVSVESLDEQVLNVLTAEAGRLSIPRAHLKSMHLGARVRPPIYSGPRKADDWSRGANGTAGWMFVDQSLVGNGPALSQQTFNLPSRFVLKFTLKWQANPSYIIYFADPLRADTPMVDRYYLQFNSAGMEVKRESTTGKRFQTVILLPKTPDEFPDGQVEVELRVDRRSSRIHLLLDGEPEGAGVDPCKEPPTGQGIALVNQAQAGLNQEIRAIEVLEFDDTRERHLDENRGDVKLDSLISRAEDRWSGHLTQIKKGADEAVFSFKSDFQEAPLELTESDVATVFFAERKQADEEDAGGPPIILRLRGETSLQVASCVFSDDLITASHPLLGDLQIRRGNVVALEFIHTNPKHEKEQEPEE